MPHPIRICIIFGLNEADSYRMRQKTGRNDLTLQKNNCTIMHTFDYKEAPKLLLTPDIVNMLSGKNGVDCYSKNGHAVTVLTRQS